MMHQEGLYAYQSLRRVLWHSYEKDGITVGNLRSELWTKWYWRWWAHVKNTVQYFQRRLTSLISRSIVAHNVFQDITSVHTNVMDRFSVFLYDLKMIARRYAQERWQYIETTVVTDVEAIAYSFVDLIAIVVVQDRVVTVVVNKMLCHCLIFFTLRCNL